MTDFAPKQVRYIKLGRGDRWAPTALAKGEIHFGHSEVSHELCLGGDWDRVERYLVERRGESRRKARDDVREIRDFYTLGADCLWITFANGRLWWAFAQPEVIGLGASSQDHGARMRRVIGEWRNTDLKGTPLRTDGLSSRLTQVQTYRRTICKITATDYLLRRIQGHEEPAILNARRARAAMVSAVEEMIANLHWADFETLVDLIFARSGWQRLSRVGGTQKDVDLVVQEPATGETAIVQVKSQAGQAVLDDYIERFEVSGLYARLFFVCHTPNGPLSAADEHKIRVWTRARLADVVIKAGLYDWLIERSM